MLISNPIVRSGFIASGQVGWPHLASGAVRSGDLGITAGTPNGTLFLRDDFAWTAPAFSITSGQVGSGIIASGTVPGFFGPYRGIMSGTVGVFDFGSGAVVVGTVGSGAIVSANIASGQIGHFHHASGQLTGFELGSGSIVSGRIASGQIGTYHFASGAIAPFADGEVVYQSGVQSVLTAQTISGVLAVSLNLSGQLVAAQASQSGTMPAIGVVIDNVASGIQANVYTAGTFQLTSGIVNNSGYLGQVIYVGRSGQLSTLSGWFNSGGLLSGDIAQPIGVAWNSGGVSLSVASFLPPISGPVLAIASGVVQGFFGASPDNIASGTIGVFDFGSGALIAGAAGSGCIVSANIASGQIGRFHVASGRFAGFELGSGAIVSGRVASGQIGFGHLADGSVQSGTIASGQISWAHLASGCTNSGDVVSGAVPGFFGPVQGIQSGTVGSFDLSSGGVQSGAIASGAVSQFKLASGAVNSGQINTTAGTPGTTTFLRGDFTWATPAGGSVTSGSVGSGIIASGAVPGFFGPYRGIMSGTVGVFDFGSGALVAGAAGSGCIVSANVASGIIGTNHFGSGAIAPDACYMVALASGGGFFTSIITAQNISGVLAVSLNLSGALVPAMASLSGTMPAIGVVFDNIASGISANVYTAGAFQLTSGIVNNSGYLGQPIYVGRSGQLCTVSGWFNSGGLLSGDITQPLGIVLNSGGILLGAAATLPFVINQTTSGNIASGQIGTYHATSGMATTASMYGAILVSGINGIITAEIISGVRAVCFNQSGHLIQAMAATSGRMPAIGVAVDNVLSGIQVNVYAFGMMQYASLSFSGNFSGYLQQPVWVGRSGHLTVVSGSWASNGYSSGDIGQKIGLVVNSGAVAMNVNITVWSGGPLGESTGGII